MDSVNIATAVTNASSGWRRAEPIDGPSYFGSSGYNSEIDHLLATRRCKLELAAFVRRVGGYCLAGEEGALSDHAALVCEVIAERAPGGHQASG